jgi:hypothetical protein
VLLKSVRATDLDKAEAEGDASLRVCLAKLPLNDDALLAQVAVYLVAGWAPVLQLVLCCLASPVTSSMQLASHLCGPFSL